MELELSWLLTKMKIPSKIETPSPASANRGHSKMYNSYFRSIQLYICLALSIPPLRVTGLNLNESLEPG